jgi:FKBP-type peptidyl-prolyl cis-trans isomerase
MLGVATLLAEDKAVPIAPSIRFTEPEIIQSWGWLIAREKGLAGIEINAEEISRFLTGFADGVSHRPSPYDLPKIYPDVERLAKARREKITRAIEGRNEIAARKFFEELQKNTNVLALSGGVRCEIVKPGSGPLPKQSQTVNVHYVARLIDGTEFAEMGPIDFVLVTNRSVCRGWIESLQKINPGGRIKLYVPPPLAETEADRWGIEPGSAMIFEIELFNFKETSPEDLANSTLPPAPEPEPPPPSGYTDRQIIETWGRDIALQSRAEKCQLNTEELSLLIQGLSAGIQGKPPPFDLSRINSQVRQFVTDRLERSRFQTRQKRIDEMNALFATLKHNTNVVELPDGLRYEILKPGSGPCPRRGQIVRVDYTGRLLDGTIFDKTYNEPLHIEVGSVIPGWNEGIQKINRGGKIKLYVPPSLGYGTEDMSGVVAPIPADSTLIYEIELLEIREAPGA